MKSKGLMILAILILSTSSCVTVKMDEPTQQRVDAATVEVKRLNDELTTFQKDIQALVDEIKKLRAAFGHKE